MPEESTLLSGTDGSIAGRLTLLASLHDSAACTGMGLGDRALPGRFMDYQLVRFSV
jgi:hypothetical protein